MAADRTNHFSLSLCPTFRQAHSMCSSSTMQALANTIKPLLQPHILTNVQLQAGCLSLLCQAIFESAWHCTLFAVPCYWSNETFHTLMASSVSISEPNHEWEGPDTCLGPWNSFIHSATMIVRWEPETQIGSWFMCAFSHNVIGWLDIYKKKRWKWICFCKH